MPHDRLIVPVLSAAAADALTRLAAHAEAEVVAVALDVGQAVPLDELHSAALAAGAVRCHAFDLRTRLAEQFLWPALRSGAVTLPGEPVATALTAPCVAEALAEVARLEHASAVVPFADDPRDRQRLHAAVRALSPGLGLVLTTVAVASPVSRNLWATTEPLPPRDQPSAAVPGRSGAAARVTVRIERGVPVGLNGVPLPPVEIIDSAALIAREHGVGASMVRDGERRWRVDAPAVEVLSLACRHVAERTIDDRAVEVAESLSREYAALIRDGLWFSPLRTALEAFMVQLLAGATGDVTMVVHDGRIEVEA